MKVRSGFVSNSSSSSFIVVFRYADINEIDDPKVMFLGRGLSDGMDYFHPEGRIAQLLKDRGLPRYSELLYVEKTMGEEQDLPVDEDLAFLSKSNLHSVKVIDADYHCTDNFSDFERYYYED